MTDAIRLGMATVAERWKKAAAQLGLELRLRAPDSA